MNRNIVGLIEVIAEYKSKDRRNETNTLLPSE